MLNNENDKKSESDYTGEFEATAAVLSSLREQVEELEKKLRLARGTGDVWVEATAAVASLPPATVEELVERLLRRDIMTTAALSRAIGVPVTRVQEAIRQKRPQVHNLGSPDQARWSWRIGDKASTAEVNALVERLISDSPMTFREICQASGVREGLVQGALVEIRRARKDILNLGTPNRGRWFIPAHARPAHLPPKNRKE